MLSPLIPLNEGVRQWVNDKSLCLRGIAALGIVIAAIEAAVFPVSQNERSSALRTELAVGFRFEFRTDVINVRLFYGFVGVCQFLKLCVYFLDLLLCHTVL